MPKGKNKKYSKKQMKIARVAPPRDKITGADFAALKKSKKRKCGYWLSGRFFLY